MMEETGGFLRYFDETEYVNIPHLVEMPQVLAKGIKNQREMILTKKGTKNTKKY